MWFIIIRRMMPITTKLLDYFTRGAAVGYKGTLVIEHPAEMFFPEKIGLLNRWRVVVLGESALTFYERKAKAQK